MIDERCEAEASLYVLGALPVESCANSSGRCAPTCNSNCW